MNWKLGVLGVLGALGVAVPGAIWYFGLLARHGFGDVPRVRAARARAATHAQVVSLSPYGLTARVPSGTKCPFSLEPTCLTEHTPVVWKIRTDSERGSLPEFAGGEAASTRAELVGELRLAGFAGHLFDWSYQRTGGGACTFRGWLDDPLRGLLRLEIEREGSCDDDTIATIVSTAPSDATREGPADSWPDLPTRERQFETEVPFHQLADDSLPAYRWRSALDRIVERPKPREPMRGEALRRRVDPSVTELVERRVLGLVALGTVDALDQAAVLVSPFDEWDRERARSLQARVVAALRKHWEGPHPGTLQQVRTLRGTDCRLTSRLLEQEPDTDQVLALARSLQRAGLLELHASLPCASVLARHRDVPEVATLLDAWHDPKNIPAGAELDYLELADFAKTHAAGSASMRRHTLAMLANRAVGGQLRVEGSRYVLETKHRVIGSQNLPGLPPDGATLPLRVCDLYALAFDHTFRPYESERERDEHVRRVVAEVRRTEGRGSSR